MIYLANHRLLFVKPRKTAGTSVEVALSHHAGAEDIVTPMTARGFEAEQERLDLGGQLPRNWAWSRSFEAAYLRRLQYFQMTGKIRPRFGRGGDKTFSTLLDCRYFNHISPTQLWWRAPKKMLRDAHIVTIVRDPYEFVVSLAFHLKSQSGRELAQEIDRVLQQKAVNEDFYFSRFKPHFVIRFEHLQHDLAQLDRTFGLRLVENLAVTNNKQRTDRRPARAMLSAQQIARVRRVYKRIFAEFDYAE
jgi:hypothetical protein